MIVAVLGTFMVVLDTTIVNIALPRIILVFESTVNQGQLVLTGYLLALAIVMPATGYLSDRFGARRTYLTTIALFTVGSALCGLAPSIEGLVVFRILQGLGGGLTQPLAMGLLLQASPPRQRGAIMGIFGLPILIAPILGPSLGGYLVEFVDWRVIFTLNVPIGLLAFTMGALLLRESPLRPGNRFDWPGFLLSALGFSAVLLGLERAPEDGWFAPHVVALWLIGATAIPAWAIVELSSEHPLLDLKVLGDRAFRVATLLVMIAMVALYASLLLLPLFLQSVRGLGAFDTGLLLIPQAVSAGIMMPISGRVLDRFGPRLVVLPGLVLLAYATWLLAAIDLVTPDDTIRLIMFLRGIAIGLLFMPLMTVAMDTIPPHELPRASALSNVLRQLVAAFGTAMFASFLVERTEFHRAMLSQTVTPSNPNALALLSTIKLRLLDQGLLPEAAERIGVLQLARQVTVAATVRSFDDCFLVSTVVAVLSLPLALLLKRGGRAHAPVVMD
jgi:DHA2 family multidrug resistance protein